MKYLVLFEEFDNPLGKAHTQKVNKDTNDDELTDEEKEATDMLLKQYYVNHEEEAVKTSHKNARYRAL